MSVVRLYVDSLELWRREGGWRVRSNKTHVHVRTHTRIHTTWHCLHQNVEICVTIVTTAFLYPLALVKCPHNALICTFERMCVYACKCEKQRGEGGERSRKRHKRCSLANVALMWTRWKEPQPGSSCRVIELQLGLLVCHPEGKLCCYFLNCYPVSVTLSLTSKKRKKKLKRFTPEQWFWRTSKPVWSFLLLGLETNVFVFLLWHPRGHLCLRNPEWLHYMTLCCQ